MNLIEVTPTPTKKAMPVCRFGKLCARLATCKFEHPELPEESESTENSESQLCQYGNQCRNLDKCKKSHLEIVEENINLPDRPNEALKQALLSGK